MKSPKRSAARSAGLSRGCSGALWRASGARMSRSVGGGSPRRLPHSTQGAGDCKEKRLRLRLVTWDGPIRWFAGVAMAAPRPTLRTYLDYNATAPLRPEALNAVISALTTTGNPSSVHAEGRLVRRIVEEARADVARLAKVAPRCVTFVSGGTEAVNFALNPFFGVGPGAAPLERLIVSAGEHLCVMSGHRFPASAVEIAPLTADGRIDLTWLAESLRKPGRALLALQGANNETGVIQPVAEASAL